MLCLNMTLIYKILNDEYKWMRHIKTETRCRTIDMEGGNGGNSPSRFKSLSPLSFFKKLYLLCKYKIKIAIILVFFSKIWYGVGDTVNMLRLSSELTSESSPSENDCVFHIIL